MPQGTGASYLANVPAGPWDVNPELFFRLTAKSDTPIPPTAYPGPGSPANYEMPHEGIISDVRIMLEGNVSGAAAGIADPLWGYNLLEEVKWAVPAFTDTISLTGMDLHVLRFIRFPALQKSAEFYSTTPDENGNFRVMWHVPLAMDRASLVGSYWAQSSNSTLVLKTRWADLATLGLAGATITGTVKLLPRTYAVPFAPGTDRLQIPDLKRIHGLMAKDVPIVATGAATRVPLDTLQAQLMRLLVYVDLGSAAGTPNPVDFFGPTQDVEAIRWSFGAKNTPFDYEPAWSLAAMNAEDYSSALPKGYVCFDFIRENPPRDTIVLPGVTDPRVEVDLRSGAVLANDSHVHLVQEILYVQGEA